MKASRIRRPRSAIREPFGCGYAAEAVVEGAQGRCLAVAGPCVATADVEWWSDGNFRALYLLPR